jgi:hypothetical protein
MLGFPIVKENDMTMRPLIACFAVASTLASAQMRAHEGMPARVDVTALLNLDETRAAVVQAIFETQHRRIVSLQEQLGPQLNDATRAAGRAALRAIRQETDRQLASVLTADELEQLHEAVPVRRPRS